MNTINALRDGLVDAGGGSARHDLVVSFVGNEATVRKTGMVFPRNLSERSWERIGSSLRELSNSSAWWLADWLIYGEASYGWRRYREAIERTGLDYQTLRNYAWVARRFEQSRRRDGLSFAHHAELARLAPAEQDYWLRKAEQQAWSRNELRRRVRASLAERVPEPPAEVTDDEQAADVRQPVEQPCADRRRRATTKLTIELSTSQLDCYARVAAANGLSVDEWVTRVLDAADRRVA